MTYRQRYSDDAAKREAVAAKRMDEAMNAVLGEIGRVSKAISPAPPSDKHLASEIEQRWRDCRKRIVRKNWHAPAMPSSRRRPLTRFSSPA